MTETIIKRKIIKKKKKAKKVKKVKPTQEQKQTQKQIINIYNSDSLRNPLGINRQKQKDKINSLQKQRVYRPISINQHVNSFEVEQRLYRKLADENRATQLAAAAEKQNTIREAKKREAEIKRSQEKTQADMFNHIKNLEKKIDERGQLERPNYESFDKENSMGYDRGLEEKEGTYLENHHKEKQKEKEEKEEYFDTTDQEQSFKNLFIGGLDETTEKQAEEFSSRPRSPDKDPIEEISSRPRLPDKDPIEEIKRKFKFTKSDLENNFSTTELINILEEMEISPTLFNNLVDDRFEIKVSKSRIILEIMKRKSELIKQAKEAKLKGKK